MKYRMDQLYLGILVGRDVTTSDIYARAAEKLIDRLSKYRKALKALSLSLTEL